jgi:hypothetical protein
VDGQSIAHELPELYRAVLDRVALLERVGLRREAGHVRRDAIAFYSFRWDDLARRRLTALIGRVDRVLAGTERPRGRAADAWLQAFRRPAA